VHGVAKNLVKLFLEAVMTYQIDWGAKPKSIAILLSLQLTSLILPLQILASTPNLTPNLTTEEDVPEEVLRAEIYTDARSPIDGKKLTAVEYVELMEKLRSLDSIPPEDLVNPRFQEVIGLLKLRKFLKQFIPFIP